MAPPTAKNKPHQIVKLLSWCGITFYKICEGGAITFIHLLGGADFAWLWPPGAEVAAPCQQGRKQRGCRPQAWKIKNKYNQTCMSIIICVRGRVCLCGSGAILAHGSRLRGLRHRRGHCPLHPATSFVVRPPGGHNALPQL